MLEAAHGKGTELVWEGNETKSVGESVEDILRSSIMGLAKQNKEAHDLLLKRAGEGFFEQHQTRGALKNIANQLLNMLETHENENES